MKWGRRIRSPRGCSSLCLPVGTARLCREGGTDTADVLQGLLALSHLGRCQGICVSVPAPQPSPPAVASPLAEPALP